MSGREDVLAGLSNYTPGPWELRGESEYATAVWARVSIGADNEGGVLQPIYTVPIRPTLQVGHDGHVYAHVCYDSYRQFPSRDFVAMQGANAEVISRAPALVDEIRELRRSLRECVAEIEAWGGGHERVSQGILARARSLLPDTGDER